MRHFRWDRFTIVLVTAALMLDPNALRTASSGVFHGGKENLMHRGTVTVCFVGDTMAKHPQRAKTVMTRIQAFTYVANLHFESLGACPPPERRSDGLDYYPGDVRILLSDAGLKDTDPIEGRGCPHGREDAGHAVPMALFPISPKPPDLELAGWANFPKAVPQRLHCQYTMWLGGNGYVNVTLHEFGHSLGLVHEHDRVDVDPTYCEQYVGGNDKTGLLTLYDPESVMHYSQRAACTRVVGNYSNVGLSDKDKLVLHILYPEDQPVAEFVGSTLVKESDPLDLVFGWRRRGAIVENVAKGFQWKIDDKIVGSGPNLALKSLANGRHQLSFDFVDFLDRPYHYSGSVRAVSVLDYKTNIRAAVAARMGLL